MEFGQLRIFHAVAEEGSIARAAERLHRVPSNLSTRLRQLEEQLGVDLFLRERQRLQLSPAGKVLLDYAARLFALQEEARAAVQGGEPVGDFALGSMYSTAAIHLPPRLAEYHRRYPAVNLQLQTAPSGELVESLLGGRLDAVLVDGPLDFDGLEGLPMFEERMVLVTENGHPPVRGPEERGRQRGDRLPPALLLSPAAGVLVRQRAGEHGPGDGDRVLPQHAGLRGGRRRGGADAGVDAAKPAGAESVAVHALAEPFARASTWLVWRKGMVGANLKAWIGLLQGRESALA